MRTADQFRIEAATVVLHVGRSWTGHDLEDSCPCPQEPCGLVAQNRAVPDCVQHGHLHPPRSMRQGHPAGRCPARLEPHHAACRSRSADEQDRIAEWERLRRIEARRVARFGADTIATGRRIAAHFREEAS